MSKKYIIAVDIQLTAPLHISAIESGSYDMNSRLISRFNSADKLGIGCSLTRTFGVVGAIDPKREGAKVPFNGLVPLIPASTIVGKIRRAATDLICDSLVRRGLTLSAAAYNTMTSGAATTDLNTAGITTYVSQAARQDLFLSLFGGTTFGLKSSTVFSQGWPLIDATRDMLMTPPLSGVLQLTHLNEMTEAVAIIRKNDVKAMRGKCQEQVIGSQALAKYIQTENEMRAESKANRVAEKDARKQALAEAQASGTRAKLEAPTSKKTILEALNAFEVVRTGMGFAIRIAVTARTSAYLGLLLLAVQSFLRSGQVGGKETRGFGTFTMIDSRLYEVNMVTSMRNELQDVFRSQEMGFALIENELLVDAVEGATKYVRDVTPDLIEAFAAGDEKVIKAIVASHEKVAEEVEEPA